MITFNQNPAAYGLSGDDNWVEMSTDKCDSANSKASLIWAFQSAASADGDTLKFVFLSYTFTLTAKTTPNDSGLQFTAGGGVGSASDYRDQVYIEIGLFPDIYKYFTIEKITSGGDPAIKLTLNGTYKTSTDITMTNAVAGTTTTVTPAPGAFSESNLSLHLSVQKTYPDISHITDLFADIQVTNGSGFVNLKDIFDVKAHLPDFASVYPFPGPAAYDFNLAYSAFLKFACYGAEKFGSPAVVGTLKRIGDFVIIYGSRSKLRANTFGTQDKIFPCFGIEDPWTNIRLPLKIDKSTPIWLYFFAKQALNLNVNYVIHYTDESTPDVVTINADPIVLDADMLYYFQAGWNQVNAEALSNPAKEVCRYTWQLCDIDDSDAVLYSIDYNLLPVTPSWLKHIMFSNGLGGIDTLPVKGESSEALNIDRQIFEFAYFFDTTIFKDGEVGSINATNFNSIKFNTGWYGREMINYFSQCLMDRCWLIDEASSKFLPILPITSKVQKHDTSESLFSLEFEFRFAWSDKAINLS